MSCNTLTIRDFGHKDANFLSIDQRTVKVLISYWGRNISVKPGLLWALFVYVNVRRWLVELVVVVEVVVVVVVVTSIVVQLQLQTSEKSYQCWGCWVSSYYTLKYRNPPGEQIKSDPAGAETDPACHTAWVLYWIIYTEFCHVQDLYCREQ